MNYSHFGENEEELKPGRDKRDSTSFVCLLYYPFCSPLRVDYLGFFVMKSSAFVVTTCPCSYAITATTIPTLPKTMAIVSGLTRRFLRDSSRIFVRWLRYFTNFLYSGSSGPMTRMRVTTSSMTMSSSVFFLQGTCNWSSLVSFLL